MSAAINERKKFKILTNPNRKASLQTLKHYKCLCNSRFSSIQILRNFCYFTQVCKLSDYLSCPLSFTLSKQLKPNYSNSLSCCHILSVQLTQTRLKPSEIQVLSHLVTFSLSPNNSNLIWNKLTSNFLTLSQISSLL